MDYVQMQKVSETLQSRISSNRRTRFLHIACAFVESVAAKARCLHVLHDRCINEENEEAQKGSEDGEQCLHVQKSAPN